MTDVNAETPAIATHALTKDYGRHRGMFNLSLTVNVGEALGFIGPNGAGKTTTLRMLMDLIRPTSGSATVLGLDTRRDSLAVKRLVGYLPAESPDYPNHTGARILDLLAHLRGGVDPARITDLAQRFDLDLGRRYREYSRGNKQKIWIIQAFMHAPRLLLLDEPTSGLDPLMQQVFRELVAEARSQHATIFLSSHVLPEVQEICDRIAVVHNGELRQVGTMDELRLGHVHQLDITTERDPDATVITALSSVANVTVVARRVHCTVSGPVGELLAALQPAGILSVDSTEMSLEEVFLSEYGQATKP